MYTYPDVMPQAPEFPPYPVEDAVGSYALFATDAAARWNAPAPEQHESAWTQADAILSDAAYMSGGTESAFEIALAVYRGSVNPQGIELVLAGIEEARARAAEPVYGPMVSPDMLLSAAANRFGFSNVDNMAAQAGFMHQQELLRDQMDDDGDTDGTGRKKKKRSVN